MCALKKQVFLYWLLPHNSDTYTPVVLVILQLACLQRLTITLMWYFKCTRPLFASTISTETDTSYMCYLSCTSSKSAMSTTETDTYTHVILGMYQAPTTTVQVPRGCYCVGVKCVSECVQSMWVCMLLQFTALWAMVTMGIAPIKVLHITYIISLQRLTHVIFVKYQAPTTSTISTETDTYSYINVIFVMYGTMSLLVLQVPYLQRLTLTSHVIFVFIYQVPTTSTTSSETDTTDTYMWYLW